MLRGSRPGWRRPVAAVVWIALGCSGCQDEYPIAPTRCDQWCEATKSTQCGYYDPAACVASCESQGYGGESCTEAFDAALACFRHAPDLASYCSWRTPYDSLSCQVEQQALYRCATQG
jgi:hypothetical protein